MIKSNYYIKSFTCLSAHFSSGGKFCRVPFLCWFANFFLLDAYGSDWLNFGGLESGFTSRNWGFVSWLALGRRLIKSWAFLSRWLECRLFGSGAFSWNSCDLGRLLFRSWVFGDSCGLPQLWACWQNTYRLARSTQIFDFKILSTDSSNQIGFQFLLTFHLQFHSLSFSPFQELILSELSVCLLLFNRYLRVT